MDENRTMDENKTGEDVQKLQNEAPQSVQLSAPSQFMDFATRPGKTRLTECSTTAMNKFRSQWFLNLHSNQTLSARLYLKEYLRITDFGFL